MKSYSQLTREDRDLIIRKADRCCLKDVARKLGVSVYTIQKVLRAHRNAEYVGNLERGNNEKF